MDPRTLRVLEFDRVREQLAALCATPLGEALARSVVPETDFARVQELQQETAEGRALLREGGLDLRGVVDFRPSVQRAARGGVLEPKALLEVLAACRATRASKVMVGQRAERLPLLVSLTKELPALEPLEARLERCLSEDGQVLDAASPTLARVRREVRATQERIRTTLEEMVRSTRWARMLQDPLVTVRGDRYVVPVKQAYASQFPGVVHDRSASGATLFMEPLAVLQLGNRLRQLQAQEAQEIERVLGELSREVGARVADLERAAAILGRLDFVLAKARLAEQMEASQPRVVPQPVLDFRGARHPLLLERARRDGSRVVPVDVQLGERFQTLVITGPNTGGKTVTLKTVGLLTLMAQAGLAIPADPDSRAGVFRAVFADIGDEQSIEQNLSTFSSHMQAVVRILREAGPGCLVLLDELGAGTDPAEGCALALAVVETLHERGACTVVTTHYGELKSLAYQLQGVENASVEFDPKTLQPTYHLRIGLPGRSHAFWIAQQLGLEEKVVALARSHLAEHTRAADAVLEGMERHRRLAEEDRKEAQRLRGELDRLRREYEARLAELERERVRKLEHAREEAQQLVARAQEEVEALLRSLRTERRQQALEQARLKLRELRETLRPPQDPGRVPAHVEVGARVRVASLGVEGVVLGLSAESADVLVGSTRVRVPRAELRQAQAKAPAPSHSVRPHAFPVAFPTKLDLRGLTTDDAIRKLEKYLDDAVLAGATRVLVIHGKGTGALRRAVHEALRAQPGLRFVLAGPEEGGEGATVVEFTQ